MTILTPELIEKAAEALFLNSGWRDWEKEHYTSKDLWRARAKVALTAVIPDVVASCAAVADIAGDVAIAAEIRSLIPQEGK